MKTLKKKRGNPNVPAFKEQKWKPGQSGNPGGRPKKNPITECYRAHLEEPLPHALRISLKLPKGTTWTDALTMAQLLLAIKGNTQAAKEITDRVEGKVAQQAEVANSENPSPSVLTPEQIYKRMRAVIGIGQPMEYRVKPPPIMDKSILYIVRKTNTSEFEPGFFNRRQ